jgi:hypothetical protein
MKVVALGVKKGHRLRFTEKVRDDDDDDGVDILSLFQAGVLMLMAKQRKTIFKMFAYIALIKRNR